MEKMVWAREEVAFMRVEAMVLLLFPTSYWCWISSYDRTGTLDSPSTNTPTDGLSRTFSPPFGLLLGLLKRSWTCSL